MIDLEKNELDGTPISDWIVKFRTPLGFRNHLSQAVQDAKQIEMPLEMIQTIPCAIATDGSWEPR